MQGDVIAARLPQSCPYTIHRIQFNGQADSTAYLIRERDQYGEFPHIYAKICTASPSSSLWSKADDDKVEENTALGTRQEEEKQYKVIILSDTGCGMQLPNPSFEWSYLGDDRDGERCLRPEPESWNLGTFLEFTLNPGGDIPYLVMTTHCHYDHIMGIGKLPPTSPRDPDMKKRQRSQRVPPPTTVLTSSLGRSFVTPYSNLQRHSLCDTLDLDAPKYTVGIWAEDMSRVVYTYPDPDIASGSTCLSSTKKPITISTPITVLHMPGHTPDSIAWYDAELRLLCVGDSFYVKETSSTRTAPWGPEPPMPTMFNVDSDLVQWWESLHKVLKFVQEKNAEVEGQVTGKDGGDEEGRSQTLYDEEEQHFKRNQLRTNDDERLQYQSTMHSRTWLGKTRNQSGFDHPSPDAHEANGGLPTTIFQRASIDASPSDLAAGDGDDDWLLVSLTPSPASPTHEQKQPSTPSPDETRRGRKARVRLAAAHTTLSLDAEAAIYAIKSFIKRVLRDQVPARRIADGARGEEQWVWDYALDGQDMGMGMRWDGRRRGEKMNWDTRGSKSQMDSTSCALAARAVDVSDSNTTATAAMVSGYAYSLLSPLFVIEDGRRRIPREEWMEG